MGETFVAIADDANTLLWTTPAVPLSDTTKSSAASWLRRRGARIQEEQLPVLLRPQVVAQPLRVSLRRIDVDTILDDTPLGQGTGWSWDASALYPHGKKLKVAIAIRDVTDAGARYKGRSGSDTIAERRIPVGAAYNPVKPLRSRSSGGVGN